MSSLNTKKQREDQTIEAMISIYCRGKHGSQGGLCAECGALLRYSRQRIVACPLKERKTTCSHCPIHCYTPAMREQIRQVMRYAGPRMIYQHPILTFFHVLDRLKRQK